MGAFIVLGGYLVIVVVMLFVLFMLFVMFWRLRGLVVMSVIVPVGIVVVFDAPVGVHRAARGKHHAAHKGRDDSENGNFDFT